VAGHILSASAGHGDLRSFYASRWSLPVSAIADETGDIKALVRGVRSDVHGTPTFFINASQHLVML
jgi:hypothetical protein